MYPFKKTKLNDCAGDRSRRWYIEFYARDVQKSALIRKRYHEVNNIASEQDRRIYANRIIQQLNKLLKEGYHFDINKGPYQEENQENRKYSIKLGRICEMPIAGLNLLPTFTRLAGYKNEFPEYIDRGNLVPLLLMKKQ